MENNLPKGWSETNLSEVVSNEKYSIVDGPFGSHLKRSDYVNEGIPLVRILNIAENFKFNSNDLIKITIKKFEEILRSQINPGDILFSKAGTIGRVCIVPDSLQIGAITSSCAKIKIHESLNRRLFLYQLSGSEVYNYLLMIATGSTRLNLNLQSIKSIPVKVPPLTEQHRIVAKLDTLFEKIESNKDRLEKIPILLKRFRQSVLAAAVSGKLTEEWRQMHQLKEWVEVELDSVIPKGGIFDGPFGSNLKTSDYTEKGVRVIRLENIEHLFFVHDKATYITKEKYKTLTRHTVGEGDIIFSSFISEEIRACILPQLSTKAIAKADCFCIRPDEDVIDKLFLLFVLISSRSYEQLVLNIHGATRPRINTTQLKMLSIPLPELEEQKEIVHRVEQLFLLADKLEARYAKAKTMLNKLPQSILAKAFRGELVPQDPNDEPASALLERIKAEKHMSIERKHGKRKKK